MTEAAVLLQHLSVSRARLNLAFISRSYADALACFPRSGILFWGILQGTTPHSVQQCGAWLQITDVQSGSHRLHLTGSCEVSSCSMWSPKMSHGVRLFRPSTWRNMLKQGDSTGLDDALNHKPKIQTFVTPTTESCKHTGYSLGDITATTVMQRHMASHMWKVQLLYSKIDWLLLLQTIWGISIF